MLHESTHVCLSTDDGIGTLWLNPPGGRIGAGILRELLPALELVERTPGIEILGVRSGTPVGFGRGLDASSINEDLPRLGQRVTAALAELPIPTVAFLEGPVTGPGLELALACDYRLAVAGPDSWVGFGELPSSWGGQTRLRRLGRRLHERSTAREAVRLGVFDLTFCERRAKIELRTWLDQLQFAPRKPAPSWRSWFIDAEAGFAAERQAFRQAIRNGITIPEPLPSPRLLGCVGLIGTQRATQELAAEFSMRGVRVVWVNAPDVKAIFREPLRRGRLTPLEAEQAGKRVHTTDDADTLTACDFVILSDPHTDLAGMLERDLLPRTVLCVPPAHLDRVTLLASRPQRVVGLRFDGDTATLTESDPDTIATVAGWLGLIGVTTATAAMVSAPAFV